MTKNRTVDDRNTIRGLVQTKEFYIHVKHADARARETPEIDWRGRVYVGRVQALAEAANLLNDPTMLTLMTFTPYRLGSSCLQVRDHNRPAQNIPCETLGNRTRDAPSTLLLGT